MSTKNPITIMEEQIEGLHTEVLLWKVLTALLCFGVLVIGVVSGIAVQPFNC